MPGPAREVDNPEPGSDEGHRALVSRCQAGDPGAWDEFLDEFSDLIFSTILEFDLSYEDRQDVFQQSVEAMYRGLSALRDADRLVGWIIRIASNQSVTCLRRRIRERRALDEHARDVPSDIPDGLPEQELIRLETAQLVRDALGEVSPRCRRLLTYLFVEHPVRPYDEIATLEGIPRGSIGPTRRRCLQKLHGAAMARGLL